MLDIRRALEYLSEDPRSSEKLGLGAVLMLAPILNLAAVGYEVEVARRVAQGDARPLPEWNDLRRLWAQGAGLGLAYFVYGLPILLIVFGGMVVGFVGLVVSVQSESARTGGGPLPPALLAIILALAAGAVAYSLLLGLLRPAILAEYAQRGTFQGCFDIGSMWRFIRRAPGEYLLLWLAELVLGWIISVPLFFVVFALGFFPFVGPLVIVLVTGAVSFFLLLVSGHMVGQLLSAAPHSAP